MSDASTYQDFGGNSIDFVAAAAFAAGALIQLADGKAGVIAGLNAVASGDTATAYTTGLFTVTKKSGVVILDGGKVYWDRANAEATPLKGAACFYIGTAVGDAASSDTTAIVNLNAKQTNKIEMGITAFDTTIVKTAGTPDVRGYAGGVVFSFSATAEAQKVDALSVDAVRVADGPILEARLAIYNVGDAAALDFNIGLANGTHASDADSITEAVFFHVDGNALDIKAESDDGTTEVAATDTTIDAVDDTYFEVWIDARDPEDVHLYINGVRVLSGTTFDISAAAGPLKALVHMEKTADDTPGEVRVESLTVRSTDLA